MKNLIEKIKIHLWYDWRILKAKKDLMDASLKYNNDGTKVNETYYNLCRMYLYDLYFHRQEQLKEV